ncbi:hypothetical protein [Ruminiclostridium papyrosolvens]|uniref:Lipoprotein n=1 Tax=Ruminiclostridium papyrosolvens C7 TaxID=1330534 RepID=U4R3B2_9FIRM|nr:hypothetical protein [Ruminiclostridium papyrosolvens]EPR12209.1 hypothetical protein L323_08975 [Ruminiclostridium papyrosolvens C7]
MKKLLTILMTLSLIIGITACTGGDKSTATLDTFIKSYTDAGVKVDAKEKPVFAMIGAKDGVIFYMDNEKTAIYEYSSEKELKKNKEDNNLIKDWPSNGRFLLETKNQKAIDIFNGVK